MAKVAVRREFSVGVSLQEAWDGLSDLRRWPEWAPHILSVEIDPDAPLGPQSAGTLRIRRAGRTRFRMSAWDPFNHWEWIGGFPGFRVRYDHRFDPEEQGHTRLEWIVELGGPLGHMLLPLFALVYGRNVDRAIPRLVAWFERERFGARPPRNE